MSISPRTLRPSSTFTPRSISGLALWLDASDSGSLFQNSDGTVPATASSDPVGYWGDKSGNGRHAVQATAARRPSVIVPTGGTEMVNGRQALWATGSSASGMTLGNISGAFPNSSGTAFFAYKVSAGTTSVGIDNTYSLAMSRANNVNSTNTDTGEEGLWRTTRLASYNSTALPRTSFGASIYTIRSAADEYSLRSKGAQFFSTGTQNWNAGDSYHLWSDPGGTMTALGGWIGEALFYNRALSVLEVQRVERYLATRWGITLAPQVANADAQDWVNRVYANGGTVSSATATAVNQFCVDIESAGLRDRFRRLNLFCGTGLNACLTPLYRAASLGDTQLGNATDTNVGPFVSGDYVESAGLTGTGNNGIGAGNSKHLRTGLTPATVGFSSGHLSAFIFGLNQTAPNQSGIIAVRDNGSSQRWWLDYRQSSIVSEYTGNNFTTFAPPVSSTNSHIILSRTSLSSMRYFQNGSQVGSEFTTSVSGTGGTADWPVFATLVDGSPTSYAPFRMGGYSIGIGMTPTQAASYTTAMQAFQTAMSRA